MLREKVQSGLCDNPVWHLPYFVTCQVKKRIVLDGSAKFDGECINDYFSSGPDTLNQLSHILARFRVEKFAFMADITECFFQVNLPENQRDLFCLLWFENNDMKQGKIIPFRFRLTPGELRAESFHAK